MGESIHYGNASRAQRELIEHFIHRDIAACQSCLVSTLMEKSGSGEGLDGFEWDEVTNLYPDPSQWRRKECVEYLREMGADFDEEMPIAELRNQILDHADANEVYEWWLITDSWVADKLKEQGEVVLDNDYGTWWGADAQGNRSRWIPHGGACIRTP